MTMATVTLIIAIIALVLSVASATGHCPASIPLILVCVLLVVERMPAGWPK